ncbi:MAG TPA: hypothetical protein VLV45_01710 [Gemmatimonadales bacterium]|nr:hypothetical protein [Gemmatimonadales bacterium]
MKNGAYLIAPRKLKPDRDGLKANYLTVWQQCTIVYDPDEPGAEVEPGTRTLKHGQINHIIRDNLKYPGPPNPANPAED